MRINKYFIFDTSSLISAYVLAGSASSRALNLARKNGAIATTTVLFNEFAKSYRHYRFEKYLPLSKRNLAINIIKSQISFFPVKEASVYQHPATDQLLELAIAADASCIVTENKDLLALNPYEHVPIITPEQFLIYFSEFSDPHLLNEPIDPYVFNRTRSYNLFQF